MSRSILSAALLLGILAARPGLAEGIRRHDGSELAGTIQALTAEEVRLGGTADPVALHEVAEIRFTVGGEPPPKAASGPLVVFRGGQLLAATTVTVDPRQAIFEITGVAALHAPTASVAGFRLRPPHREDDRFRSDLAAMGGASPAREDRVYVERGKQLIRLGGLFRSLDADYLSLEYGGRARRIPRSRVFAVLLAPVASRRPETGLPAVVELGTGGEMPVSIEGFEPARPPSPPEAGRGARIAFRVLGAAAEDRQWLPTAAVRRVRFASDRVMFLSDANPVRVEELPVLGGKTAFPWRRDKATDGRPLRLGERTYRKGLGVHSRSVLEFDVGGRFATFAATVGLVEAAEAPRADRRPRGDAKPTGAVTFRVVADDKELLKLYFARGDEPRPIALPLAGVRRLRLEVDFGPDRSDRGDHAAWAEARAIKE